MALCVCPTSERNVCVITSDGRVFVWTLSRIIQKSSSGEQTQEHERAGSTFSNDFFSLPNFEKNEHLLTMDRFLQR